MHRLGRWVNPFTGVGVVSAWNTSMEKFKTINVLDIELYTINSSPDGVKEMCFVPGEFHLSMNFLSDGIGKILLHYGYYSKYIDADFQRAWKVFQKGSTIDDSTISEVPSLIGLQNLKHVELIG